MPDAYSSSRIDDLPTLWDGMCKLVRPGLGLSAFGVNVLDLGAELCDERPHRVRVRAGGALSRPARLGHAAGRAAGQEERVELVPDVVARVAPEARRLFHTGPEGARLLIVGGAPGKAYVPPDWSTRPTPDAAGAATTPVRAEPEEHDAHHEDPERRHDERDEVRERDEEGDACSERDPAEDAQCARARDERARRAEHHHAETELKATQMSASSMFSAWSVRHPRSGLAADVRQREVEERGEHEGPGGEQVAADQDDVPERRRSAIRRPHGLQQADGEEHEQRRPPPRVRMPAI